VSSLAHHVQVPTPLISSSFSTALLSTQSFKTVTSSPSVSSADSEWKVAQQVEVPEAEDALRIASHCQHDHQFETADGRFRKGLKATSSQLADPLTEWVASLFTYIGQLWASLATWLYRSSSTSSRQASASAANTGDVAHLPQYVLDYAPYVYLYSGEQYWPCDIAEHLLHTTPYANYTPLDVPFDDLNLGNLDQLNKYDNGRTVFMQSDDDVEDYPDWLGGEKNKPEHSDSRRNFDQLPEHKASKLGEPATKEEVKRAFEMAQSIGGRSPAPAVAVVIEKEDGIVDAFWFFFYSFNLGNVVFNLRFGNHVGDWEHTLVRFQHGEPKEIFLSQHEGGDAYTYQAIEKIGRRVCLLDQVNIAIANSYYSLLFSRPLAHTPCMRLLASMPMHFLGASSTI
jgi:hypothetical protein